MVLEVRNLSTHVFLDEGVVHAVEDVSFDLPRGKVLGLVGESGSGKTMTGISILGLVEEPVRIVAGEVRYKGEDILRLDERRLRQLRGNRIAMIFQDPMMTLNPVLRIDTQIIEAIQAHSRMSTSDARARARDALGMVGVPSPEERLSAYPHQFSGGMRQRVAIAIAMLHRPDVIIADEPTTALDVTIQAQILAEVQKLAREQGTALIWITHDLSVVSNLADDLAVMYAGRIVESGPTESLVAEASHPYTRGLIASLPVENRRGHRIRQIPGSAPSPMRLPAGCAFRQRCDRAEADCVNQPDLAPVGPDRFARCFHPWTGGQA
jgi:peptide/nickel transport system ATP-binding protein